MKGFYEFVGLTEDDLETVASKRRRKKHSRLTEISIRTLAAIVSLIFFVLAGWSFVAWFGSLFLDQNWIIFFLGLPIAVGCLFVAMPCFFRATVGKWN